MAEEKEKVLTQEQIFVLQEQARLKAEHDRLMALKVALTETSSTRGWAYIKHIAQNIVQGDLQHALNVEDDTESKKYLLEARVAQRIFGQVFTVVDTALDFGTESEPEWFSQLDAFQVNQENGNGD